jgi:phosphoribosylformylglycinamidine synthase
MATRIEVKYRGEIDSRGEVIRQKVLGLMKEGVIAKGDISSVEVVDAYTINSALGTDALEAIAESLRDPVTQDVSIDSPFRPDGIDYAIEIGFLPGVTDNVATTVRKGIEARLGKFEQDGSVHSTRVLLIRGDISSTAAGQIGTAFANPLIQRIKIQRGSQFAEHGFAPYLPKVILDADPHEMVIPITDMSHEEIKVIAKKGIFDPVTKQHRGPLALDVDDAAPMRIIRDHYKKLGRNPTDVELECLAQTWSEHCKHMIFAAALDEGTDNPVLGGLFRDYIRGATDTIRKEWKMLGRDDFLLSVFNDNSGVVKFDGKWAITDKVETHNSPSALDPYGGSITGIVGVDRDAIGVGMGAMPFNHRFYFCFADPRIAKTLFKRKAEDGTLEQRMLSSRSIMDGVIEGVKDGGNKSGIPTPQGGAFFHERYSGKPLVFVGVQGLLPMDVAGKPGWEKKAEAGDLVVMIGGRVGMDGIHGATFSSESMDAGSPMGAVQIGDPITQKKLSDAACKEARDRRLYRSITDNGAGGLSCSVYEMARECGGAKIDIDSVPLKYPGMRPDQILISESQERMTLSVPREKLGEFMAVMKKHDVEATVIGEFTADKRAVATYQGRTVLDLDMDFFHDGLTQRHLKTTFTPELYRHDSPYDNRTAKDCFWIDDDLTPMLLKMLGRLNVCSKEFIFEQFDHEVQGGSVVKPLVGKGKVDSEATVTRPVLDSRKGVATTQALFPRYSEIDTYHMAACAIDTAVRNLIAVGGDLEQMALLDNFCWCSSDEPERLGQLKRAAKACYDVSTAYLTPLVSGKDSMFNTLKGFDENGSPVKVDVLPTLMISGLSVMDDAEKCQTLDAKVAGDLVYVISETRNELGGSEYYAMVGEEEEGRKKEYIGNNVPKVDTETNLRTYKAMQDAIHSGLVASCASVGVGGLGVALAKTAIGGQLGLDIDVEKLDDCHLVEDVAFMDDLMFSESQGRFVVTVDQSKQAEFEEKLEGVAFSRVGTVTNDKRFVVRYGDDYDCAIVDTNIDAMAESYKSTLRGY